MTRNGDIFGFRDPDGIRPLVLGKRQNGNGNVVYALASETVALSFLGFSDLEDVLPGEAVYIDRKSKLTRKIISQRRAVRALADVELWFERSQEFKTIASDLRAENDRLNLALAKAEAHLSHICQSVAMAGNFASMDEREEALSKIRGGG